MRIVRVADAEPHEVKKIAADDVARRMQAAAVGDLDHRRSSDQHADQAH